MYALLCNVTLNPIRTRVALHQLGLVTNTIVRDTTWRDRIVAGQACEATRVDNYVTYSLVCNPSWGGVATDRVIQPLGDLRDGPEDWLRSGPTAPVGQTLRIIRSEPHGGGAALDMFEPLGTFDK